MSEIGIRVKKTREAKGLTLGQLATAAGGLKYQTIQDLESGKSKGSKHLVAIARALSVTADWLQTGEGSKTGSLESTHQDLQNNAFVIADHTLPSTGGGKAEGAQSHRLRVLGMAEGGPDGWSLFNGDLIETVPMPANLVGVKDAYGVYVVGDSMSPRYRPGEIAHIHPYKPLTIGAFVLVQKRPKAAGEPPLAVIKELVRRSGSKITLSQLNPPKTFDLKVDDIVSIHRVVGSAEA